MSKKMAVLWLAIIMSLGIVGGGGVTSVFAADSDGYIAITSFSVTLGNDLDDFSYEDLANYWESPPDDTTVEAMITVNYTVNLPAPVVVSTTSESNGYKDYIKTTTTVKIANLRFNITSNDERIIIPSSVAPSDSLSGVGGIYSYTFTETIKVPMPTLADYDSAADSSGNKEFKYSINLESFQYDKIETTNKFFESTSNGLYTLSKSDNALTVGEFERDNVTSYLQVAGFKNVDLSVKNPPRLYLRYYIYTLIS